MRRLLIVLACLLMQISVTAQDSKPATDTSVASSSSPATESKSAATSDRMFFPKDWYWGWAQFDLAPPHNEVDPNLCASNAGMYGGKNSNCSAFARYMISGTFEARPFGRTVLRRAMFFFDPTFLFGRNVPQTLYTWSWDGIGMEYAYGLGVDLPKRFQFRFTAHPLIQRFGSSATGPAYLGPNGPWGRYNAVGVRKYFGTRREGTD